LRLLGRSTSYIERNNLTSRLFNGRQARKTLAFSKDLEMYRASAIARSKGQGARRLAPCSSLSKRA